MDRESLSQYGWVVILIVVLCILLCMATPFGNYISTSTLSMTTALTSAINNSGFIKINADSSWTTDEAIIEVKNTTTLTETFKNNVTDQETQYYIYGLDVTQSEAEINNILPVIEGITYQIEDNSNDDFLTTGAIISAYKNNSKVADYYLVILGDINGDGYIDSGDISFAQECACGIKSLTGVDYMAADINNDGEITDEDVSMINDCGCFITDYNSLLVAHGLM